MFKFIKNIQPHNILKVEDSFESFKYFSNAERIEIEKLFKRVLLSDEGQKIVAYLQFITCQKASNSTTTKEQLYFNEGQRALVINIIRLISKN